MKIKNVAEFCKLNNITDSAYLQYFDEDSITEYINFKITFKNVSFISLYCAAHLNIDHLNKIKKYLGDSNTYNYSQFILGVLSNSNISQETKQLFIDQDIKEHVFK